MFYRLKKKSEIKIMRKIILTGFEAFNGREINPSKLIVEKIVEPEDTLLVRKILPVEFKATTELLNKLTEQEKPDIILSIGQAGNVPNISVERVAINLDNCKSSDGKGILADACGDCPIDRKIIEDGPDAFISKAPIWDIVKKVNDAGVMCRTSYSAGTYVCNHVMYVGAYISSKKENMISVFVHVPFLPEQLANDTNTNGKYTMPLDDMVKGIQIIVDYLAGM